MPTTTEITRLLDTLSDYEREHFLRLLRNAAGGERFWEIGVATVYNEYVKTRSSHDLASASFDPADAGGIFAPIPITKTYPGAQRVFLPLPGSPPGSLEGILRRRRSRRESNPSPIEQITLSTLLHYAAGINGTTSGYGYTHLPLRSFPSCGGLQCPEIYASVQDVTDVPPGIYHYQPQQHALELLRQGDHRHVMRKIALGQTFIEKSSLVLVISGSLERLRWKYGERAYRYLCVDVGGLMQNLYLVGEALGFAVCAVAGFIDDAAEQLLGLDGEEELPVLLVAIDARRQVRGTIE